MLRVPHESERHPPGDGRTTPPSGQPAPGPGPGPQASQQSAGSRGSLPAIPSRSRYEVRLVTGHDDLRWLRPAGETTPGQHGSLNRLADLEPVLRGLPRGPGIIVSGATSPLDDSILGDLARLIVQHSPSRPPTVLFTTPVTAEVDTWLKNEATPAPGQATLTINIPHGLVTARTDRLHAAGGWYAWSPAEPGQEPPRAELGEFMPCLWGPEAARADLPTNAWRITAGLALSPPGSSGPPPDEVLFLPRGGKFNIVVTGDWPGLNMLGDHLQATVAALPPKLLSGLALDVQGAGLHGRFISSSEWGRVAAWAADLLHIPLTAYTTGDGRSDTFVPAFELRAGLAVLAAGATLHNAGAADRISLSYDPLSPSQPWRLADTPLTHAALSLILRALQDETLDGRRPVVLSCPGPVPWAAAAIVAQSVRQPVITPAAGQLTWRVSSPRYDQPAITRQSLDAAIEAAAALSRPSQPPAPAGEGAGGPSSPPPPTMPDPEPAPARPGDLPLQPGGGFTPTLISRVLDELEPGAAPTGEQRSQAEETLATLDDATLSQILAPLPLPGQDQGRQWIRGIRARAAWTREALRHRAGDPASAMPPARRAFLVLALTSAGADERDWLAAQELLSRIGGPTLAATFSDERLLPALHRRIPRTGPRRGWLDHITARLTAARTDPRQPPPQPSPASFTLAPLHPGLAGITARTQPSGENLSPATLAQAAQALTEGHLPGILANFARLEPEDQDKAGQLLTRLRVALDRTQPTPGQVPQPRTPLFVLDQILIPHFRDITGRAADAIALRDLTLTPPAELATALQSALSPLTPSHPHDHPQPADFTGQPPGSTHGFNADLFEKDLRQAYRQDIDVAYLRHVAGRGRAAHDNEANLRPMEHIDQQAEVAWHAVASLFSYPAIGGRLRADLPGQPGNIHDLFTAADSEIRYGTDDWRRTLARRELLGSSFHNSNVSWVLAAHHVQPLFDRQGEPRDDKTAILSQVIEGLLNDHRILAQVLFNYRGWPGQAEPATRNVWVQRFRGRTPEEDQLESVQQLGILTHETTHTEHPGYTSHYLTIPAGTSPYSTMREGLPSWLTTLGWENIWPRLLSDIDFRRVVEGPHADSLPPLPETLLKLVARHNRYASDAQVIHVASLAGSWENWLAAALTGAARKVTGPLTTHAPVQAGQPQHPAAPQQPTSTPPAPETPRN